MDPDLVKRFKNPESLIDILSDSYIRSVRNIMGTLAVTFQYNNECRMLFLLDSTQNRMVVFTPNEDGQFTTRFDIPNLDLRVVEYVRIRRHV